MGKVLIGCIRDGINLLIGNVAQVDAHLEPVIEKDSEFLLVRDFGLQFSANLVLPSLFRLLLLVAWLRVIRHHGVIWFVLHHRLAVFLFLLQLMSHIRSSFVFGTILGHLLILRSIRLLGLG